MNPGLVKSPGDENVTRSSICAWEIPWTEKPGRLQSLGSQRVKHDLATEHRDNKADISKSWWTAECRTQVRLYRSLWENLIRM